MKTVYLLVLTTAISFNAHGEQVKLENLTEGWVAHNVTAATPEAIFSGNAEAVLNFNESGDDALASLYVHHYPIPETINLSRDAAVWHKVFFPQPGKIKVSVVSERTYLVNGKWRYIIEYQADTGTMLNSIAMLTVSDGQLHMFLFEQHRPLYLKLVASVRQMFKKITIHAAAEDTQEKPLPKSEKTDKS